MLDRPIPTDRDPHPDHILAWLDIVRGAVGADEVSEQSLWNAARAAARLKLPLPALYVVGAKEERA